MANVKITPNDPAPGMSKVVVEGADISQLVQRAVVTHERDCLPTVELDLIIWKSEPTVLRAARLMMPVKTAKLLQDYGWTPPPVDKHSGGLFVIGYEQPTPEPDRRPEVGSGILMCTGGPDGT
jgi:hypothetical protein